RVVQPAVVHARAAARRGGPVRRAGEVRAPEGPRAALARARGVDRAAVLAAPEDALVVRLLGQAGGAVLEQARVALAEVRQIEMEVPRERRGLVLVDAHRAGRARAAVAAARALEAQAVGVPGAGLHGSEGIRRSGTTAPDRLEVAIRPRAALQRAQG